ATGRGEGRVTSRTVLGWRRGELGRAGSKEGCNEGDCGAGMVMVTDAEGVPRALNACILFLPQLQGRAVRTVEGVAAPDGRLHPVQQAMITHHGSQCGFCTPGFVMSMVVGQMKGVTDHDTHLAGNLCRCTGYAPIIRAAKAVEAEPVPDWLNDPPRLKAPSAKAEPEIANLAAARPGSLAELEAWCAAHPKGVLVAGATDVGLWITKQLRSLPEICF